MTPIELPTAPPSGLSVIEEGVYRHLTEPYHIAPGMADLAGNVPVPRVAVGIPDRRWQASGILANPDPDFARHQPVGRLALGRNRARMAAGVAAREGMWAAGDALVGPSTVVEAMAQGQQAARAILQCQPHRPGATPAGAAGPEGEDVPDAL